MLYALLKPTPAKASCSTSATATAPLAATADGRRAHRIDTLATSSPPVGSTAARGSDVSSTLKKSNHLTHRRGTYILIHVAPSMLQAIGKWSALLRSAGRNALGYGLQRVREVVYGCSWYCAASPPPRKAPSTPSSHVAGARARERRERLHPHVACHDQVLLVVQVQLAERRVRSRACQVDAEVVWARAACGGPTQRRTGLGKAL